MFARKAMILAAGRGERMRPLTDTTPKPLIQVGSRTLIEHHLVALAKYGFSEVVINLAHLGEHIRQYLGSGARYGLDIRYSAETAGALETAGGIQHALPLLGEAPFLVINGDIRCDIDFSALTLADQTNMHLVMVPNPPHHPEGDFYLDTSETPAALISMALRQSHQEKVTYSGVGIYHPRLFAEMSPGAAPLAPIIQQQITTGGVTAELFEGYWTDVGTPERLEQARAYEARISF